jgi:hypothetical protein
MSSSHRMTKNVMSFDKLGKAEGEKPTVIHTRADGLISVSKRLKNIDNNQR